jgi:hypothetical protein
MLLRSLAFAYRFGVGSDAAYFTRSDFKLEVNRFLVTQEIQHVRVVVRVIMA